MKQKKAWSFFQSLGKAFMYPIALLSVCGMMLGLGSGLASDDMAKLIPFLAIPIIKTILDFIVSLGLFAFVNLPVLFAIAIPLGLLKDKEDKEFRYIIGKTAITTLEPAKDQEGFTQDSNILKKVLGITIL